MNRHCLLVEVEAEFGLIFQVAHLLNVHRLRILGVQLLWHLVLAVVELLEKVWCNGKIVASGQLRDLANVAERGTHDDGIVAVFLVVVEDLLHGLDAWVFVCLIVFLGVGLIPVKNAANEGRDQEGTGFSSGNSLDEGEHEGQVAVDAMFRLKDLGGSDTFPCRGELDQDP